MAEKTRTRPGHAKKTPASRPPAGRGPEHAANTACQSLERLIGHHTEGVSAVRRHEDGWCVVVDVLEVPRIPDTTSLLASYEVLLDQDGELLEYSRVRRYRRGAADE
ncbi:gas vesicle protein [Streptomyces nitrosporeus]|uniref:Gas vesicle protein n=1 Tax=Streptomyces nitrosporeus TaxID=28894 RepID=A0A5J6FIJ8_9ACTN|nr:gas vesicle protein [Streptomyces nitrosporeus]QEU76198.1 gas vesicle protein [Streptomyces nitrosporeus]GGZ08626.1 gas vesicle protein [Streptomyces nitrosporeus]